MIASFRNRETERVFGAEAVPSLPPDIQRRAYQRSASLHAACSLADLTAILSLRLEALSGRRAGQHSIRINDQGRVCFSWDGMNAHHVEIVDYHDERR